MSVAKKSLMILTIVSISLSLSGCASVCKAYVWAYEKAYGIPDRPMQQEVMTEQIEPNPEAGL